MGDGASPCFGECTDNRMQNTSYQICKAQVLVFGKDTRISLVWTLRVPTVAVPGPLSTILCQGHLRNPLCSLRVVTFLPRSALTAHPSVLSKSRWHLTAPSPFPSHCPGVAPYQNWAWSTSSSQEAGLAGKSGYPPLLPVERSELGPFPARTLMDWGTPCPLCPMMPKPLSG